MMKDFLPKPLQNGRHEKVSAVKRSVIKNLRGVPLLHLADTLHDTNETVNKQEAGEICSANTCERVGEKNVQAAKRVL